MESLEALWPLDDFLNFSSDIEEDQNPEQEQQQHQHQNFPKHPQNSCKTKTHQTHLSILDRDQDSSPVLEELEWLKEDKFPPLEPFLVLPVQSPPKHQSPVSVLESGVGGCGFRVPGRARSRRQRRRRVGAPGLFGFWVGGEGKNGAMEAEPRRRCRHCLAEKTPQWRAGPHGPKTLCNACGVRYKAGRLVPEYRPASSPTFSSELHSNSHRKILEMRRKKQKALENG